jgi:serine/threonine protein kinase
MTELSDALVAQLQELIERPDTGDARYRILGRIGEGGMGAVYRAHDAELGRDVALKVLRAPEPSEDETARILREAHILATLEHPGIVPVHDVGALADGRVFYVMKLVNGERLDVHARAGRDRNDLLRIVRHVCDAVAFAHERGIVHRDLKPQNVMLGAFGEVLVLDWGVAKAQGERLPAVRPNDRVPGAGDTASGTVLGTPGYMAPEQSAAGAVVDERADVYGIGGILSFLLTGAHPAEGDAIARRADVPAPLRSICQRARAADPAQRYPSAAALGEDIDRYVAGLPVRAHREGFLERTRRVALRHRTPILLVAAYLVMRAVMLAFTR